MAPIYDQTNVIIVKFHGKMVSQEFVKLMLQHRKTQYTEMREAWQVLNCTHIYLINAYECYDTYE